MCLDKLIIIEVKAAITQEILSWSLVMLQRHGDLGEPIAKPACTLAVQFAF
jgi:hypothetical protein